MLSTDASVIIREGRLKALPRGHRIFMFLVEEQKLLVELFEKESDITLDEIRTHFGKQGSLNAVHKIVKILGFVFKKFSERRSRSARTSCTRQRMSNMTRCYGRVRNSRIFHSS